MPTIAPLQTKRFLGDRVVTLCRNEGDLEELDAMNCRVHLQRTANSRLQIDFYPDEQSPMRFVIRMHSRSRIEMTALEER
jgi:hypothetical protein